MNDQQRVSACHKAPMYTQTSDEGTSFWKCGECFKPCDAAVPPSGQTVGGESRRQIYEISLTPINDIYYVPPGTSGSWGLSDAKIDKILEVIATHTAKAVEEAKEAKDNAYWERNQLVAALSKIYPAWLGYHKGADWEDDWRTIVYIKIPTHHYVSIPGLGNKDVGQHAQLSWHIHDSEKQYFEHLDPGLEEWDGHTTVEKYDRLATLKGNSKEGDHGSN